jgi:acyl transferase domain-containing protein
MSSERGDQIAVIGMAGRFPGAHDVDEFWLNLVDGVESITFFSDEELRAAGVRERHLTDPHYVKAAPIVPDMELFDAGFFGFTAREAEVRDPQHRMFLETVHTALEHAGYDVERCPGAVGVYGGTGANLYAEDFVYRNQAAVRAAGFLALQIANTTDYLATTVSYKLGLRGPSLTVATACSTSLVAVHLACQGLRDGECDMAVVGGVELGLPPVKGYPWEEGGIFSRDGHCRSFDARAQGTIFGSGCGAVVLKRLGDAQADGDRVYAVIRGSAINNDGADKSAFSAPSVEGQAAVVARALEAAGVDPETISYVEAHGTGTLVGDPIEVAGLTRAFRASTDRTSYCAIGSVKTNVGHLGAAAGIAGLIKTVLAMEHGQLPPHLHYERPNPSIDFAASPFYVNTALSPWSRGPDPRRAGVSSFGIGGTNAHLVLEEPPTPPGPAATTLPWQLLPLSAKTPAALDAATVQLAEHLRRHPDESLADVAYTLQVGRTAHSWRRAVVCRTVEQAAGTLTGDGDGRLLSAAQPARPRSVALMFPGQGAQYVGMGAELYEAEPVFRQEVDRCAAALEEHLGFDLRGVLYPPQATEAAADRLRQTAVTQPALFTVEYALAKTLESWGVEAEAMIGHSIGEYVAACLAGVFSLEDALSLVAARGALMQALPGGAMMALPVGEDQVRPLLGDDIDLAAVNAPSSCVASGPHQAVGELERVLAVQGILCRPLQTSHAFHSRMMDPIIGPFRDRIAAVERRPPSRPFLSNLTGEWITSEQATDPSYWVDHLRNCVRFANGAARLLEGDRHLLVEVGPGETLTTLVGQQQKAAASSSPPPVPTMRHPRRQQSDVATLLAALGTTWLHGGRVDWQRYWSGERRRRVPLPTYPFERRRFWIDPDPADGPAGGPARAGDQADAEGPYYLPTWKVARLEPDGEAPTDSPSTWLVFLREEGAVGALVDKLRAAGGTVLLAATGRVFAEREPGSYTIRPREREDYDRLAQALAATGAERIGIVHAWSVGRRSPAAGGALNRARGWQDVGFFSVLHLVQAAARRLRSAQVDLYLLSSDMQDVTGAEQLEPAKATLLGLCKLIPKELTGIRCRSVDLSLSSLRLPAELVADQLMEELTAAADDQQVAYRSRRRWVWSYQPTELEPADGVPAPLHDRGVYLITGGLGGLGLVLAEGLARLVRARLVLVGRSGLPDRSTWPERVASQDGDQTTERIRKVQAIEAAGGEVLVCSADVADERQMRAVRAEAEAAFGCVDGVFHAAGVAGGAMLEVRAHEDAAEILAPKVDGTIVLDEVFGPDLDFVVLYSSIATISGDFGLSDYCSANAFLDAWAHARWSQGQKVIAINWPPWEEVGMAEAEVPVAFMQLEAGLRYERVAYPLLDYRVHDLASDEVLFTATLGRDDHWALLEHRIGGRAVMPGTAILEMVCAAFREATQHDGVEVRDLVLLRPLDLEERRPVRLAMRPGNEGELEFVVLSQEPGTGEWADCARGRVRAADADPAAAHDLDAIRDACGLGSHVPVFESTVGFLELGPRWNSMLRRFLGAKEELVLLELPASFAADLEHHILHPALLDSAIGFGQRLPEAQWLPMAYDQVVVRHLLPSRFYSHIQHLDDSTGEVTRCNITLIAEDGTELVAVRGYTLRRVEFDAVQDLLAAARSDAATRPGATPVATVSEPQGSGIAPDKALEVLWSILAADVGPQVLISMEGLDQRLRRTAELTQQNLSEQMAQLPLLTTATARNLATPYVAPENELEQILAELWQETLGVDRVGIDDDFFDLGGNSLVGVQIGSRIHQRFQVEVPMAALFEGPTVRNLASAVSGLLLERVESLSEEEAARVLAGLGQPD